jgi:hypothetical protein
MIDIPRGLLIRCVALVLGTVPLTLILKAVDLPGNLAGVVIIVYAAFMGFAIAEYYIRHPDEPPMGSPRR